MSGALKVKVFAAWHLHANLFSFILSFKSYVINNHNLCHILRGFHTASFSLKTDKTEDIRPRYTKDVSEKIIILDKVDDALKKLRAVIRNFMDDNM